MENDIETVEIAPGEFGASPFPLSVNTQKRLLELIYNRKSGIVTRQELIDVIFNKESNASDKLVRCRP
jgi:DNA-binding winged helix-turn-helix (wHTH) protein